MVTCSKEETMEADRTSRNTVGKKKNSSRRVHPAVSVITETDGEFSLILRPLNKDDIQKVSFKTPDRCAERTGGIYPRFLKMLTETQRGLFRKNEILGTVFLTDGEPCEHLIPLEKASKDSGAFGRETYFGIDRRRLTAKLTGTRILFEKAFFIDISNSRAEAFFSIGEQVISCFPFIIQNGSFSPADTVISLITESSEIIEFAEDFAPDALFISIPSPTEKDIKRISGAFDKKSTTLFFQTVDNSELALFAAEILADRLKSHDKLI